MFLFLVTREVVQSKCFLQQSWRTAKGLSSHSKIAHEKSRFHERRKGKLFANGLYSSTLSWKRANFFNESDRCCPRCECRWTIFAQVDVDPNWTYNPLSTKLATNFLQLLKNALEQPKPALDEHIEYMMQRAPIFELDINAWIWRRNWERFRGTNVTGCFQQMLHNAALPGLPEPHLIFETLYSRKPMKE